MFHVEPEAPITIHARLEVECERQAVPQRVADGGAIGYSTRACSRNTPLSRLNVCGAHLEHPVERVAETQGPSSSGPITHTVASSPAPGQTIPCWIAA